MSLVEHAKTELARIGEDEFVIDGIVKTVQAFADSGHSGYSAAMALEYLDRLLRFEPLSPLTNDLAEWTDLSEMSGYPIWQSTRDPKAFSEDGGKTYWTLDEREAAGSMEATPLHITASPA